jgi:hypothetical protein
MQPNDGSWFQKTRAQVGRVRTGAAGVVDRLPPGTSVEVRDAVVRLRTTESAWDAFTAFEDELESLFERIVPLLVEHPLPVHNVRTALTTVTCSAGLSAALDEIELLTILVPGVNTVAVPSLPLVLGAALLALVVEAYVAASYRTHQLRDARRTVDPEAVMRDVLRAMTGRDDATYTGTAARTVARRFVKRWGRGIVPFVGVGYASLDARQTIRTLAAMPLPAPAVGAWDPPTR